MTREQTSLGRIAISTKAMATIASQAALSSYGVVGMASKNFVGGIANLLVRDPRHSIDIKIELGDILVDLYIIVEYGTRITSVAASVANAVQYQLERALGQNVAAVNVHVQNLRISNID